MGIFSRFKRNKAEVQTAPTEAPKKFDIDVALNTPGFSEFLSECPDGERMAVDETMAGEVQKRFEAFQQMTEVSKALKGLYATEIAAALGVNLDKKEYASVDAYLRQEALARPDMIAGIDQEIKRREDLKNNIETTEARLNKIKVALGPDYLERKDTFELASRTRGGIFGGIFNLKDSPALGWLFRTRAESRARKIVTADYKMKLDEAKAAWLVMQNAEDAMNQTKAGLDRVREAFDATYHNLFNEVEVGEALMEKAREQTIKDLQTLARGDLGALDQALERYQKLKASQPGVDFEGLDQDFEADLDQAIRDKVFAEMKAAVEALVDKTPTGLEKALKKIIDRKEIGLANTEYKVKDFIRYSLGWLIEETNDGAKKILLARLKVKLA